MPPTKTSCQEILKNHTFDVVLPACVANTPPQPIGMFHVECRCSRCLFLVISISLGEAQAMAEEGGVSQFELFIVFRLQCLRDVPKKEYSKMPRFVSFDHKFRLERSSWTSHILE